MRYEEENRRSAAVSSCRKSLFATTRHFSELQKALKNGDHHRAGHPSRVSRTHPSAPLTKGSRSFGWPRNRRISCGGFVVAKKSFRHDETSFRASKSSEKWGSSSCRTPFPGFPHTLFRPVDERFPLFWLAQKPPHLLRRFRRGEKVFSPRRDIFQSFKKL